MFITRGKLRTINCWLKCYSHNAELLCNSLCAWGTARFHLRNMSMSFGMIPQRARFVTSHATKDKVIINFFFLISRTSRHYSEASASWCVKTIHGDIVCMSPNEHPCPSWMNSLPSMLLFMWHQIRYLYIAMYQLPPSTFVAQQQHNKTH